MAEVKGFTFSATYYELISDTEYNLTDEQQGRLYKVIMEFVFDGKVPELRGIEKLIFSALLPSLQTSVSKSKSKRNKIEKKSKKNQNEIEKKSKTDKKEERSKEENSISQEENINIYTQERDIKGGVGEKSEPPHKAQQKFFEQFPSVIIDNYDPSVLKSMTDEDWNTLIEQYGKSPWLQANVRTLSSICRLATKIIAGEYAPFVEEQTEELTEEERRKNREWFEQNFE